MALPNEKMGVISIIFNRGKSKDNSLIVEKYYSYFNTTCMKK